MAPILFTGAAYFLPDLPDGLSLAVHAPSYHVYVLRRSRPTWTRRSRMLYATVLVLLALTFALNLAAVVVRARDAARETPRRCRDDHRQDSAEPTPHEDDGARPHHLLRREEGRRPVALDIPEQQVTALIGPSGCGKSTFLRSLNRMNELIPGCRIDRRRACWTAISIYGQGVDLVALRRRVGMVFQKSNPFPKSICENVAYGLRIGGIKD